MQQVNSAETTPEELMRTSPKKWEDEPSLRKIWDRDASSIWHPFTNYSDLVPLEDHEACYEQSYRAVPKLLADIPTDLKSQANWPKLKLSPYQESLLEHLRITALYSSNREEDPTSLEHTKVNASIKGGKPRLTTQFVLEFTPAATNGFLSSPMQVAYAELTAEPLKGGEFKPITLSLSSAQEEELSKAPNYQSSRLYFYFIPTDQLNNSYVRQTFQIGLDKEIVIAEDRIKLIGEPRQDWKNWMQTKWVTLNSEVRTIYLILVMKSKAKSILYLATTLQEITIFNRSVAHFSLIF